MMRRIASGVLVVLGMLIALGAYGHGVVGRRSVDAELSIHPIAGNTETLLYFVWYFVSGCMVVFGASVLMSWQRLRRGDRSLLPVTYMVGCLYLATGVAGMIYRRGDPFMSVFIIEGALVLGASKVMSTGT